MSKKSRRRFLQLSGTVSLAGVAGCIGGENGGHGKDVDERAPDWCLDELSDPVPEVFETAESVDGVQRNPDDLTSKEDAGYQCHNQGQQLCANCTFFIPAKPGETGNKIGACTEVEGGIRSVDWCSLYSVADRLDETPDPGQFS